MGGLNNSVTISGVSGGGYTANQMHVVYSDLIKGAGYAISGSYGDNYYVREGFAAEGIQKAYKYESEGLIDDLANLENDSVFIFSGLLDTDVVPEKQEAQKTFYDNFNSNVRFV